MNGEQMGRGDSSVQLSVVYEDAVRLDRFLFDCRFFESIRGAKQSINRGYCRVNGKSFPKASHRLSGRDLVDVITDVKQGHWQILFEDEHCLVINKPQGKTTQEIAELIRVWPVHRLDRETSGALLLAKTPKATQFLSDQFRERRTAKRYMAVVSWNQSKVRLPRAGVWESQLKLIRPRPRPLWGSVPSGGVKATTRFKVKKIQGSQALLELEPVTGRTHQIRVHCREHSIPIVGDPLYGTGLKGPMMLHAAELSFERLKHKGAFSVNAPLPEHFAKAFRV